MKTPDFCLRVDEPIRSGVQRIALEWAGFILQRIDAPSADRAESIHAIRTALKRLRGVLRLIRPGIAERTFSRENAVLAKAGRQLATARDQTIAEITLRGLLQRSVNSEDRAAIELALIKVALEPESDEETKGALLEVAYALQRFKGRVEQLKVKRGGWSALEPGLETLYRQGRKRMKQAILTGQDEDFHHWRIRVKNLYYSLQLLEPVWPEGLEKMLSQLKTLQTELGDLHDLTVLKNLLKIRPESYGGVQSVKLVLKCIQRESAGLEQASKKLGKRVFCQKPSKLVADLSRHWMLWKQSQPRSKRRDLPGKKN